MKVLVLLSLVAFCTSVPTSLGRRVRIGEDGTITHAGGKDYDVDLFKNVNDPRKVVTVTRNPTGIYDTLEIGESNDLNKVNLRNIFGTKYSTYKDVNQADVLTDIFRNYEGKVNEDSYNNALNKIQYLVDAKVLDNSVYDILRKWNVDDRLRGVSDIVSAEELARKYNSRNEFDTAELNRENIFNTIGRVGLNREDVLNTVVPTEQYIKYGRLGFNKVDTEKYPRTGLDTVGRIGLTREDVLDTSVPTEEYLKYGKWDINRDSQNRLYSVDRLQALLQQIRDQRELQQGFFNQEQSLNQQFVTPKLSSDELTDNEILREIYQYQLGNTERNPLNRYLVNLRISNGQEKYFVPEQFFDNELLENWFAKQQLINRKVDELIQTKESATEELFIAERLINEQVERFIEQLVQHQTLITVQIEKFIEMRQVVPQELVYQQRLVYQQVQRLIEKLIYQQIFINNRIQLLLGQNSKVHQEFFVQQTVVYQQIFRLIQQLFVQQTVLKEHIQVLVQQDVVVPEELVVFQKMTYEQLESFIQILIKQFVYQQIHFRQLIQSFVQRGRVIPQELFNQYTIIYNELQQLIKKGDIVPQQLMYQHRIIHQQIFSLIQQGQVEPEQIIRRYVPEQQQWVSYKTLSHLF